MNYDLFKNEMDNFPLQIKERKRLQELLDVKYYLASGVKGVDPSKEPSRGFNENFVNMLRLEGIDERCYIQDQIDRINKQLLYVRRILKTIDSETAEIMKSLCWGKNTYAEVAGKYGMSATGLKKMLVNYFENLDKE